MTVRRGVEYDPNRMAATANHERNFSWAWIALLWAGLGVFDATQNIVSMSHADMHHA